jgi:DNA-binding response OmpR family regulator
LNTPLAAVASGPRTGATVLIVEDDPTLLEILRDNLEFSGYLVRCSSSGRAAATAVFSDPPDLVLLDLMLPEVHGFDLCRRWRAAGFDRPIIILTARNQEADIVHGLNLGADDYVTKPFSVNILLARIDACLRRHAPTPDVVVFADCCLDRTARRFLRQGREVHLTPKEFAILELLVRNEGRALTRDRILDAVWGQDLEVADRSVDRCITTLRQKIEPDPHHPRLIETIREIGYRFQQPDLRSGP